MYNTIFNENCLDTMARMPEEFLDLVVTSPPYDNLRAYKDAVGLTWNFTTFEKIATALYRVLKPGGVVVWVVADATVNGSETGTSFKQALYFKLLGFNLLDTMIYKTSKPPMPQNRYLPCFEYMFVFSKGKPKTFNPIMVPCKYAGKSHKSTIFNRDGTKRQYKTIVRPYKYKENIWEFHSGRKGNKHPAIFPEQLAIDHIESWSNPGDIVYDPFMGSGTTALAAIRTGRNYIGSELGQEYYKLN